MNLNFSLSVIGVGLLIAQTTFADTASGPLTNPNNTPYVYIVTGSVASGGWEPCLTTDETGSRCQNDNFHYIWMPITIKQGNTTTLTSKPYVTGYSVQVKDNIVTATCIDESNGHPKIVAKGKVGEKLRLGDLCDVLVQPSRMIIISSP